MPQLFTEALVRSLYRQVLPGVSGVYPTPLTYQRAYFENPIGSGIFDASGVFKDRRDWLVGLLGLSTNNRVLIVGSAFGYLMRTLTDVGVECWGIEGGPWFWDADNDGEWAVGMKVRTAQDWVGSGTEQSSLDALPGVPDTFFWMVDEDAATMHSDAELPNFISALEKRLTTGGRIVHMVTPVQPQGPGDSAVNWKTMREWKAVAPSHIWMNIGTGEVE
ncbi:hypothetical protein LCGC14_1796950 [marine sediment metagenome]|uniref:Class I SAM-dependent methyltransferase n=1 Tax=marine sediment metagenome TaxID=412755 RepID=A0A0F9HDG8_9ZZZZ